MGPSDRQQAGVVRVDPGSPREPEPVVGCEVCAWWGTRRDNARRGIGEKSVEQCGEQIAAHPHRPSGGC